MTEEKNKEGLFVYPGLITVDHRLSKAEVEHLRMLYQKTLNEKWYPIQRNGIGKKREIVGLCAFCTDVNDENKNCFDCKISPLICTIGGDGNLYRDYVLYETKPTIDNMVAALEKRVKYCDTLLLTIVMDLEKRPHVTAL